MDTLTQHITHYESCHSFEILYPHSYESDLSNEVLYVLTGQKAAKIFEIKVGCRITPRPHTALLMCQQKYSAIRISAIGNH